MRIEYSIIMVTYNHERYIGKAIDSVINQKVNEEIEILIGDDGSTDRTIDILLEYVQNYSFIKVFAHENVGLSRNLYELLTNARGKYIAILEGDDYWIDNDKLEKQWKIIEDSNCIGTACNSLIVDESGKEMGLWNKRKASIILTNKDVLKYQTMLWHPSALLFRNIFLNSQDKYIVIAEASRMGGNHSGLINLLADVGKVYLDISPMTIWLSIQKPGGSNYSSQKVDSILDYYEAMKKYEYYNKTFSMDYSRYIYYYYKKCKKSLREEAKKNTGVSHFYSGMMFSYFNNLRGRIARMFS